MAILAAFMVPHPPLIIPAIGKGSENQVRKTIESYKCIADEISKLKPDTIIISSPHSVMYYDYFHISPGESASGSFARFGAPEVNFHELYDKEFVIELEKRATEQKLKAGTKGERNSELDHGTLVPLFFIREKYNKGKIVRIGLSGLSFEEHYKFGQLIAQTAEKLNRRIVYVASGDLSHKLQEYGPYGFAKEGPVYDEKLMDVCSKGNLKELLDFDEDFCDKAAECGHRSFVIMAGVLDGLEIKAKMYSHEDVTGVGYGICSFYPSSAPVNKDDDKEKDMNHTEDPYVSLARNTIEKYIREGIQISRPDNLPEEMIEKKAGAFVSIHKKGSLRGCIGTILSTCDSVADEIIQNAISASTRDPRFSPIRPDELPDLEISVDVLGEPEDIESKEDLDVKRYGVIVTKGFRRGLLLPDLDGVDTVEEQIEIAKSKAGIWDDEGMSLQRFEVIRHH